MWVVLKPPEIGLSSRAGIVSALFIRVSSVNFKKKLGDDEYIFSCKLSEYYIIRVNSKENTRLSFLSEKSFQSLLPPVKMLTNALIFWKYSPGNLTYSGTSGIIE